MYKTISLEEAAIMYELGVMPERRHANVVPDWAVCNLPLAGADFIATYSQARWAGAEFRVQTE